MEDCHENNSLNLEQDNEEKRQIIEMGGHQPSHIVSTGSPRTTMAAVSGQMTQTRRRDNNNNRDGDASRCLDMDGDGKVSCKELLCFTCGICTGGFLLGAILVVAVYFIVTETQVLKTGSNEDNSNDVYDFDQTRSILKDIDNNMVTCGQDGIINGEFNSTIDSYTDGNLFFTIDEYGNQYSAEDYPLTFENDTLIITHYYQGKVQLSSVKRSCHILSTGLQSLIFRDINSNKLYSFVVKEENCNQLKSSNSSNLVYFSIILTNNNNEYSIYCDEFSIDTCYVYLVDYGLGKNNTNSTNAYNDNTNDKNIYGEYGSFISNKGDINIYPSPHKQSDICDGYSNCDDYCNDNKDKCSQIRGISMSNIDSNNQGMRRRLQVTTYATTYTYVNSNTCDPRPGCQCLYSPRTGRTALSCV